MELRWIPVLLTPLALGGLLWAVARGRRRTEWLLKPLCTLLVLATAALQPRPDPRYAAWIGLGLLLGVVGDLALLSKERRGLAVGLGAFLLGHLAYTAALAPRAAAAGLGWLAPALLALTLLSVLAATLRAVWAGLGRLRGPATVYGAALVTAAVAAGTAFLGTGSLAAGLAALGLLLFLVSDISVARHRFGGHGLRERLWGLPCYFAGQLLLALSVGTGA